MTEDAAATGPLFSAGFEAALDEKELGNETALTGICPAAKGAVGAARAVKLAKGLLLGTAEKLDWSREGLT